LMILHNSIKEYIPKWHSYQQRGGAKIVISTNFNKTKII
jgi:hypothetical protein